MRKLFLASAALLAMTVAGNAAVIRTLGPDPTSATGAFSNAVGGTTFTDQYTFSVTQPLTVTFASATNDFAKLSDIIANFTGQLFNAGADALPGGTGINADTAVNAPSFGVPCPGSGSVGCQILSGTAVLGTGNYYLQISGIGGGTSGYGGDITTVSAVPGPLAGAGLPGIVAGAMFLVGLARRRKKQAVV